jgi:hypothetical protein
VNLREKIHTLNIQTLSNNSTPNQTTSTTTKSTTPTNKQNEEELKKQAKNKAIEFLRNNNEWSLYSMRQSVSDQSVKSKISSTSEYKWLTLITEGDNLNDDKLVRIISNEDVLQNATWSNIVDLIKVKREQKIPIEKFQKAFKDANSNWDSNHSCPMKDTNGKDKKLSDGTIKLSNLKNQILKI